MPEDIIEQMLEVEDLLAFCETPDSDEFLHAIVLAAGKDAHRKLLDIALAKSEATDEQRGRAIYLLSRLRPRKITADIAKLTRPHSRSLLS